MTKCNTENSKSAVLVKNQGRFSVLRSLKPGKADPVNIDIKGEDMGPRLFKGKIPYIGIHTYVRLDAVCDSDEVASVATTTVPVCNSLPDDYPIDEFLSLLAEYENKRGSKTGHHTVRYLEKLTVMVPKQLKNKEFNTA